MTNDEQALSSWSGYGVGVAIVMIPSVFTRSYRLNNNLQGRRFIFLLVCTRIHYIYFSSTTGPTNPVPDIPSHLTLSIRASPHPALKPNRFNISHTFNNEAFITM